MQTIAPAAAPAPPAAALPRPAPRVSARAIDDPGHHRERDGGERGDLPAGELEHARRHGRARRRERAGDAEDPQPRPGERHRRAGRERPAEPGAGGHAAAADAEERVERGEQRGREQAEHEQADAPLRHDVAQGDDALRLRPARAAGPRLRAVPRRPASSSAVTVRSAARPSAVKRARESSAPARRPQLAADLQQRAGQPGAVDLALLGDGERERAPRPLGGGALAARVLAPPPRARRAPRCGRSRSAAGRARWTTARPTACATSRRRGRRARARRRSATGRRRGPRRARRRRRPSRPRWRRARACGAGRGRSAAAGRARRCPPPRSPACGTRARARAAPRCRRARRARARRPSRDGRARRSGAARARAGSPRRSRSRPRRRSCGPSLVSRPTSHARGLEHAGDPVGQRAVALRAGPPVRERGPELEQRVPGALAPVRARRVEGVGHRAGPDGRRAGSAARTRRRTPR